MGGRVREGDSAGRTAVYRSRNQRRGDQIMDLSSSLRSHRQCISCLALPTPSCCSRQSLQLRAKMAGSAWGRGKLAAVTSTLWLRVSSSACYWQHMLLAASCSSTVKLFGPFRCSLSSAQAPSQRATLCRVCTRPAQCVARSKGSYGEAVTPTHKAP